MSLWLEIFFIVICLGLLAVPIVGTALVVKSFDKPRKFSRDKLDV